MPTPPFAHCLRSSLGSALLAISLGAGAQSSAPHMMVSSVADLGRISSAATLCGLDDPRLVARQIGIQVSALLLSSSDPEASVSALLAFQGFSEALRTEYLSSDDFERARLCSVAWLGWRAIRSASSWHSTDTSGLASTLARDAGVLHGWLWTCKLRGALTGPDPAPLISRQSALSLALAALSSRTPEELMEAHLSWTTGFAQGQHDPAVSDGDCPMIESAFPALDKAFGSRPDLALMLGMAQKAREMLWGSKV